MIGSRKQCFGCLRVCERQEDTRMLWQQLAESSEMRSNSCFLAMQVCAEILWCKFNWDAIVDEATEHAPNLIQIWMECTRKTQKQSKATQKSIVSVCLSLLCNQGNPKMTLFQRILPLVLYAGHSAKQVGIIYGVNYILILFVNVITRTRNNPQ